MHGKSVVLLPLLMLVSLLVLLLADEGRDGEENGASRSSSLAHAMLTLERFSLVTGVVRLAAAPPFLDDDEDDDGDGLLRRVTALTGTSSSGHLGLGAAPMML